MGLFPKQRLGPDADILLRRDGFPDPGDFRLHLGDIVLELLDLHGLQVLRLRRLGLEFFLFHAHDRAPWAVFPSVDRRRKAFNPDIHFRWAGLAPIAIGLHESS